MQMRWRIPLLWFAATTLACSPGANDKSEAGDDDTSDADASGSTTDGPTSTGATESESTGAPAAPVPAHGIRVDWVEVNQGIGVRVGENGAGVGPEARTAFLLQNRRALVRAFWTIDDDWEPREIRAELHLFYADGTEEVLVDEKVVDGVSFIGDLNKSFFWGLLEEQMVPGVRFRVELYEVEDEYIALGEPKRSPHLPNDGSKAYVGVENSYQVMKIVIVPFNYDNGGNCVTQPDTSEETMKLFWDSMYMMNPVDRLEITLHEPIDWNTPLSAFGQLNSYLSDLRFEEEALPETYYYGLVDVCAGGLGNAGGEAYGIPSTPPTVGDAYQRVSSGLSLNPDWSAETFVHEVGHSQGRRHVACNGEEGGPDPTYPIDGGDVGEWGFGILEGHFTLRHPTVHKDYMTYCHPVWVSTWGWNKVYPVIRELSTWDPDRPSDGAPLPEDPYGGSLLVGTVLPNGEEIWHTVPGRLQDDATAEAVEFEFETQGRVERRHGRVMELGENTSGERMIVVPLPEGFEAVERVGRVEAGVRKPIERNAIRLRHSARTFRRG